MTLTPGVTWGVILILFTAVGFVLWLLNDTRGE